MSNPIPISSAPSHSQSQGSSHSRSFSQSYSHPFSSGSPSASLSPSNPSPILSSALNIPGPTVGLSLTSSSFNQNRSFLGSHSVNSPFFAGGTSPPGHFLSASPTDPSSFPSSASVSVSSARRSFSATSKPTLGRPVPSNSASFSSGSPPQKDCQWASAWASGVNGSVAAGVKSPGLYGGSALADEDDDSVPAPLGSSLPTLTTSAANNTQKPLGQGPSPGSGPGSQTVPPPRRVSIVQPSQEASQRGQNVLRRLSLGSGSLLRPSIPIVDSTSPTSSQPTTAISYSFPNASPGSGPSVQFTNTFEPSQHQPRSDTITSSVPSIASRRKSVKNSGGKRAISPTGERMLVGHAGGGMF